MALLNAVCFIVLAVVVASCIGLKLYTRRKLRDMDGFHGIVKKAVPDGNTVLRL